MNVFNSILALLSLACISGGTNTSRVVKSSEKSKYFHKTMSYPLKYIRTADQTDFFQKCGNLGLPICSRNIIGEGGEFQFKKYVSKETQDWFWGVYLCYRAQKISACPVDGGWTSWSDWENCAATCGEIKEIKRVRFCNNPLPMNSGYQCKGQNVERKQCKGECEKRDTFDENQREAKLFLTEIHNKSSVVERLCFVHHCTFEKLGKYINDTVTKNKYWSSLQCYKYKRACPVDGEWSTWSQWSECSPVCGNGFQFRSRDCNNPSPSNGGYNCVGDSFQEKSCVGVNCAKHVYDKYSPILSEWSEFKPCSVNCGKYGISARYRDCLNIQACMHYHIFDFNKTFEKPCYQGPCHRAGQWSEWSEGTQSSAVCGMGRSMRFRVCNLDKPIDGGMCEGNSVDRKPKKGKCTEKTVKEIREKKNLYNVAKSKSSQIWIQHDLPPPDEVNIAPLDARMENLYTQWTEWSKCSKTCQSGIRERFRNCKNVSVEDNGLDCRGEIWQIQPCNMMNCPVNGGWSEWETWTTCSVTCGGGSRTRYRRCDQPYPRFGGTCLGYAGRQQTEGCGTPNVCDGRIHYALWTPWTPCTKSCGTGEKTRARHCYKPENVTTDLYKHHCAKDFTEAKSICNPVPCPVDGSWGNWNTWSSCSGKCGIGHYYRDRTCTVPAPKNGGKFCFGPGSDVMHCFEQPCSAKQQKIYNLRKGVLLYRNRGYPSGYFSLFMQFKSRSESQPILNYMYDGCRTEKECRSALQLDIVSNKLQAVVTMAGSKTTITSHDDAIQKDKWYTVYLHLAEDKVFMRIDDDKKYESLIEFDTKKKVDFDGYTKVGPFSGSISSLKVNFRHFHLDRGSALFSSPDRIENVTLKHATKGSEDSIVGHSLFHGNAFIKVPLKDVKSLNIELVFMATSPDGLLLFNKGEIGGSYMYLALVKDALKICVNNTKINKCESLANLNMYKWYSISLLIDHKHAEVSINRANAIQITLPEKPYKPTTPLMVGGGDVADEFIYKLIMGGSEGFHGVIHQLTVNDKQLKVDDNPVMNDKGVISSIGINNPERMSEVYEHQDSEVKFRCDYTRFIKEGVQTRIEWFKEDILIKIHASQKVDPKIPGEGYVGELTLLPSDNQTGLYSCAVNNDGIFKVLHSYFLIRHDVKIVHVAEQAEMLGLTIFLAIVPVLLLTCVFGAVSYRLKAMQTEQMNVSVPSVPSVPIPNEITPSKDTRFRSIYGDQIKQSLMTQELQGKLAQRGSSMKVKFDGTQDETEKLLDGEKQDDEGEPAEQEQEELEGEEGAKNQYQLEDIAIVSGSEHKGSEQNERPEELIEAANIDETQNEENDEIVLFHRQTVESVRDVTNNFRSQSGVGLSPLPSKIMSGQIQNRPSVKRNIPSMMSNMSSPSIRQVPTQVSQQISSSPLQMQQSSMMRQFSLQPQSSRINAPVFRGPMTNSASIHEQPLSNVSFKSANLTSSIHDPTSMRLSASKTTGVQRHPSPMSRSTSQRQEMGIMQSMNMSEHLHRKSSPNTPLSSATPTRQTPSTTPPRQISRTASNASSRERSSHSSQNRQSSGQRSVGPSSASSQERTSHSSQKGSYSGSIGPSNKQSFDSLRNLPQRPNEPPYHQSPQYGISGEVPVLQGQPQSKDYSMMHLMPRQLHFNESAPGIGLSPGQIRRESVKSSKFTGSEVPKEDEVPKPESVVYISKHDSDVIESADISYISRSMYISDRSPTRVVPTPKRSRETSPTKKLDFDKMDLEAHDSGFPAPPSSWMTLPPESRTSPKKEVREISLPPAGSPSPKKHKTPDTRYRSPPRILPSPKKLSPVKSTNQHEVKAESASDDRLSIRSFSPEPKNSPSNELVISHNKLAAVRSDESDSST